MQPSYDQSGTMEWCGGSEANWPSTYSGVAGDTREYLGTWCTMKTGQGESLGGMGSDAGVASWNQPFTMTYMREYVACSVGDGSSTSDAYPCECGDTHCNTGQHCTKDISQCQAPAVVDNSGGTTGGANVTDNATQTDNGTQTQTDTNTDGGKTTDDGTTNSDGKTTGDNGKTTDNGDEGTSTTEQTSTTQQVAGNSETSTTVPGQVATNQNVRSESGARERAACTLSAILVMFATRTSLS